MKNLLFLTGIAMPLLQAYSQVLFNANPESSCAPGEIHFSQVINGAATYEWDFGDGQISNAAVPEAHLYEQAGIYDIELVVTPHPGQRLLYEIHFEDIPGGWWEIFEGQVDLFVNIYDAQNQLIYTSMINYEDNVPAVLELACLLYDQMYFMEIYDFDSVGNNDFLGSVLLDGGLPHGSINQPSLSLTYYTTDAADQYTYTTAVSVEQPIIEAVGDQLTAHVSFLDNESILDHYEWYWDDVLLPDTDTATITAPGSGTYVVYIERPGCEGWSYPFEYVADPNENDSLDLCRYTRVIGSNNTDTIISHQIRVMPNGDLLTAVQWNSQAAILRNDPYLEPLDTMFYNGWIPGISALNDLQLMGNGNWLAVGSCSYCVPEDTLPKVFAMLLDANLQYLPNPGIVFLGKAEAYPQLSGKQEHPRILLNNDTIVLVSEATTTQALNFTDLLMTKFSPDLEILSQSLINNTGFDLPLALYKNETGYAIVVNHAFVGLGITQTDGAGNALWFTDDLEMQYRQSVQLPDGGYLLAGSKDGADYLSILSETDGLPIGLEGSLGALEISAITLLDNGDILAAMAIAPPLPSIQIHRFHTDNVILFDTLLAEVPNQSEFYAQIARSLTALNEDGSHFALSGRYAFFGTPDRIFLHSVLDCPISASDFEEAQAPLLQLNGYPNPFMDQLNLSLSDDYRTLNLRMFNAQGQLMSQATFEGKGTIEWKKLGELPPGIYFIQAVADGKILDTLKVVHL